MSWASISWHPRNIVLAPVAVYAIGAIAFGDSRWYGEFAMIPVSLLFGNTLVMALAVLPLSYMFLSQLPRIARSQFVLFVVTVPIQWVLLTQLAREDAHAEANEPSREAPSKEELDVERLDVEEFNMGEFNMVEFNLKQPEVAEAYREKFRRTLQNPWLRALHIIRMWGPPNVLRESDRLKYQILLSIPTRILLDQSMCILGWYFVFKKWRNEPVSLNLRLLFDSAVTVIFSLSAVLFTKAMANSSTKQSRVAVA